MLQILSCAGAATSALGSGPRGLCTGQVAARQQRRTLWCCVTEGPGCQSLSPTLHVIPGKSSPFSGLMSCEMQGYAEYSVYSPEYVGFLPGPLRAGGRGRRRQRDRESLSQQRPRGWGAALRQFYTFLCPGLVRGSTK